MAEDRKHLLEEARKRTESLLAELKHHQRNLPAQGEAIGPHKLVEGLEALDLTVDVTQRLLQSIELSLKTQTMSDLNHDVVPNVPPVDYMPREVVARGDSLYRGKRYLIVFMFLGFGLWFIRDGFFKWPQENADAAAKGEKLPHPGWDVPMNRVLGIALPPLAILMLVWALYNSRGEYRLSGRVLHIPGHPPIPLENIRPLDEANQKKWDRKGLAYFTYQLPDGSGTGRFRLDADVYQPAPTDEIYDAIQAVVRYSRPMSENNES